jgi:hypothetical protein
MKTNHQYYTYILASQRKGTLYIGMTNYGSDFCEELIEELTVYNPIIISGFAYGVDICEHKAAMKNNLQTIL